MSRLILICAAFVAVSACHRTPDEQQIRTAITAMQHAVEAGRPRDFIAYISTNFTGNDGIVDRDGLMNIVRVEVLRNEHAGVTLGPIDLDLQGDRATVRLDATLTGGSGGLLPERASVFSITSGWRKEDGEWRCYNASWRQTL